MLIVKCYSVLDHVVLEMSCTAHSEHDAHLVWRGWVETDGTLYDALDALSEGCATARRDLDAGRSEEYLECSLFDQGSDSH
jgi:hypothetical protein